MARDSVTTVPLTHAGVEMALTAASANNDVVDTGRVFLVVENGSGASITVTVHAVPTYDGLQLADQLVTVAAGKTEFIGPLSATTFGQASGTDKGRAYVDYSAFASVNRGVYSL